MHGHGNIYTFLVIAGLEVAAFVAAIKFAQRHDEKGPKEKIAFGIFCLLAVVVCVAFYKSWLAAQLLALPLMGMVYFGHTLREDLKAKRLAGIPFVRFLNMAMLLLCAAVFGSMLFIGRTLLPLTTPAPIKAETVALIRKIGAERLRADATKLSLPQDGLPRYDLPKETWPASFSELMPVGIRIWDVKEGMVTIYLHKLGEAEVVVEVLPVGLNKQIETGAIAPQSPYGFWREKIADGVYWRSTLDSR